MFLKEYVTLLTVSNIPRVKIVQITAESTVAQNMNAWPNIIRIMFSSYKNESEIVN